MVCYWVIWKWVWQSRIPCIVSNCGLNLDNAKIKLSIHPCQNWSEWRPHPFITSDSEIEIAHIIMKYQYRIQCFFYNLTRWVQSAQFLRLDWKGRDQVWHQAFVREFYCSIKEDVILFWLVPQRWVIFIPWGYCSVYKCTVNNSAEIVIPMYVRSNHSLNSPLYPWVNKSTFIFHSSKANHGQQ